MSFLDKFDLPFINKKSPNEVGRYKRKDTKQYIPKTKQLNKNNNVPQSQGVIMRIVGRYINVIRSDINVFCSLWKPRIIYIKVDNDVEDLFE